MRYSQNFIPILKEAPSEAAIISHQLMLRAGMIRQLTSGVYHWLPLGLRVLKKIEAVVRSEMDAAGCAEILMPTLQPAELWQESGRYDDYGKEMLRITDRHDRAMLYGPTNEEAVTDIFRSNVTSYKSLPLNLYQIQWKFRDEIRPRFGVMRGREFLMKDGYSFDLDETAAVATYHTMFRAYLRVFKRLGLNAIAVRADNGAIGGKLSHEFQILAETGESDIFYEKRLGDLLAEDNPDIDALIECYAMADEMHDPQNCPVAAADILQSKGVEVGHIFYFGDKYTRAMDAKVMGKDGKPVYPEMGSYGIGVSRLVAGIIESSHDENGIIWPKEVAPYDVALINIKANDEACVSACDTLYKELQAAGISVLYDDRDESAGKKFATHDLIGLPWQISIGPRSVKEGKLELKSRRTGEKQEVAIESCKGVLLGG